MQIDCLQQWVGRTECRSEQIASTPLAALAATLDREDPPVRGGDAVPPLWHWLYFLPRHRQSEIGGDGHPQRGGFMPPVPLPRRMWAGGRLQFHRPLRVGATVKRESRIADVRHKDGRSGPLVFVVVRHELSDAEGAAITEEQDLVYRGDSRSSQMSPAPQPAPAGELWTREVLPEEVLLFRYSALTFNSHRIHYDRRYATEIEGYPGLVVHGPLLATLLLDLLRRNWPDARVASFAFRAVSPLFDTASFSVCGRPVVQGKTAALWARNSAGRLAMDATATLS